jgi:hypothetical protein
MFTPSREQARRFFFETWDKYRKRHDLQGLEKTALEVLLLHPEYHPVLEQPDKYLDRDYLPEAGAINPFLHLSLHLALAEQLSIDQPPGIVSAFQHLIKAKGSEHEALHVALECLGEVIWQAQRTGTPPDQAAYLQCLGHRADRPL